MMSGVQVVQRSPSPALSRFQARLVPRSDAAVRRRLGWIWGLLFLNVVPYNKSPILRIPHSLGEIITQGALTVALIIALTVNRKVTIRPSLFMFLLTLLCVTTMMISVQAYFGIGTFFRGARLVEFVAVLWLITPWWGRDDLLFVRFLRRALIVILGTVVLGAVISPHKANVFHRLHGIIWPMPPTQVAEFAAILAGVTAVLWFTHSLQGRPAVLTILGSLAIIVLSHTRTALVAMTVALLIAGLSLLLTRRRVRKALAVTTIVAVIVLVSFAPFLWSWFKRGENSQEFTSLTGRTSHWAQVTDMPRTEIDTLFGFGMNRNAINGLPIDSSWYSAFQAQGLVGDIINGGTLLLLVMMAALSPSGPRRAVALFLVMYCIVTSFTEDGLGQATPYLLYLTTAASVLLPPLELRRKPALPQAKVELAGSTP